MTGAVATRRQPQVAVIGAGSWGTAVAAIVARNNKTIMWARSDEVAEQINERHVNERYLPEFPLPRSLTATSRPATGGRDVRHHHHGRAVARVPGVVDRTGARTCGPGPRWSAWSRDWSRSPTAG